MTVGAPSRSGRGGTLESGLDIIEALVERATPASVTELAASMEMDKGNLHRLLKVLSERGWVSQNPDSRRYTATPHLVGLAGALLRNLDIRSAAEPVCASILEASGESVHLSVVTTSGPVYILQRRPPFRVSVATEVGARPPLHATATGKAIIAFLDDETLNQWLREDFERFTYRTHQDRESLDRDLQEIRGRGYAVDDEEFSPGTRCVAVPIFGLEGGVIGCIGISSPTQRVSLLDLADLARICLDGARDITQRMGGPLDFYPEGTSAHKGGALVEPKSQ